MKKIEILKESIQKLNVNTISVKDIEDIICQFGLVHDKGCDYGEFKKYMVAQRVDLGVYQTPRQFAECIYDLLQLDINSYFEIGLFNGGSYLIMTEFLKLKNPNVKCIGVDITDKYMLSEVKPLLDGFEMKTSDDFAGKQFDLVFIDGDHRYSGIKTDWDNVGKFAKYVIIHDINQPTWPAVKKFWNEIKTDKKHKEYLYQTENKNVHGIGLIFNE